MGKSHHRGTIMRLWTASLFASLLSLSPVIALASDQPPSDASIHEILELTLVQKALTQLNAQTEQWVRDNVKASLKGRTLDAQEQKIMDTELNSDLAVVEREISWEKMEPIYINIYRNTFTQKEVDDMIAFYKTPSGRSAIQKVPMVMQQTLAEVKTRMDGIMPEIRQINQNALNQLKAYEASKSGKASAP
jgi:uncharacterized protein